MKDYYFAFKGRLAEEYFKDSGVIVLAGNPVAEAHVDLVEVGEERRVEGGVELGFLLHL